MNEMPNSGPGFLELIAKKRAKGPRGQPERLGERCLRGEPRAL